MAAQATYCVKTEPRYGRGLYATRYLEAGAQVLREDPMVYSLSVGAPVCFSCLSESRGSPLKKCLQCGSVAYCNKECQAKHWPQHRLECKGVASMDEGSRANSLRMRLLVQAMYTHGVGGEMYSFGGNDCRCPDVCEKIDSDLNGAEDIAHKSVPKLAPLDRDVGCDLLRKIMCNSFLIFTLPHRQIGEGIYLQGALLNHSCEPNCYYLFEGKTLVIKTLKKVKAGKQLFICYVNPLDPVEHNPDTIWCLYGFMPRCVHCNDVEMDDVTQLQELSNLFEKKDWKGAIQHFKQPYKYKNVTSRIRAAQLHFMATWRLNEELGLPLCAKPVLTALDKYQKLRRTHQYMSPWDTWFNMQELCSMLVIPLAMQGVMAGAA